MFSELNVPWLLLYGAGDTAWLPKCSFVTLTSVKYWLWDQITGVMTVFNTFGCYTELLKTLSIKAE
jgi:hypothetical protein